MCDFKPGDEVECVNDQPIGEGNVPDPCIVKGRIYTVAGVVLQPLWGDFGLLLVGCPAAFQGRGGVVHEAGYNPSRFRKVQRRNDRLTIEAFSVIKDGQFEEPKRAPDPAKTRERAQ